MLARRDRGSDGDRATPQLGACQNNKQKPEQTPKPLQTAFLTKKPLVTQVNPAQEATKIIALKQPKHLKTACKSSPLTNQAKTVHDATGKMSTKALNPETIPAF
jgi:hypothetical protein